MGAIRYWNPSVKRLNAAESKVSLAGQSKVKCRPFIYFTLGPGPAAQSANDPAHVGQAHPVALEFLIGMEALEKAKKLARVLHLKTDSVIPNENNVAAGGSATAAHFDFGNAPLIGVFESIGQKVVEDLSK